MELNKKYGITADPNDISSSGVLKIDEYLASQGLPYPLGCSMGKWIDTSGEYRGKLPNRLGGLLKKEFGIILTPEQRGVIGNIAKSYTLPIEKYVFDFTDKFDWEAGDFGDRGSCFWEDRELARSVLENEGALAIRFYEDSCGSGRAWIYPLDRETWVLFNAYGIEARSAATVLAEYLTSTDEQWDCKDLNHLTVSGRRIGLVYLNAQSQIIFAGGSAPDRIDLDWAEGVECKDCGIWVLEEDVCQVAGYAVCQECANGYPACNRCGEYQLNDEIFRLEGEYFCESCYDVREKEIEEELRIEHLKMRRDAARIIEDAEQLISSLTYEEQLAAGQLQFEFASRMDVEERVSWIFSGCCMASNHTIQGFKALVLRPLPLRKG